MDKTGKLYIWDSRRTNLVRNDGDLIDQADPDEQAQQLAVLMIDSLPNRVVERFIQSVGGDVDAVFDMANKAFVKRGGWRGRRALTDEQERLVVQSDRPAPEMAAELGVSPGVIWRLRREAKK